MTTPVPDFIPAEGCLQVVEGDKKLAFCSLAAHAAVERKSRLDDIASFAADGLAREELAKTCLHNIERLAAAGDEPLLGVIDRDEVAVEIVKVLQDKMTADADMLCENALAIARALTTQGWLVVKSDGVL